MSEISNPKKYMYLIFFFISLSFLIVLIQTMNDVVLFSTTQNEEYIYINTQSDNLNESIDVLEVRNIDLLPNYSLAEMEAFNTYQNISLHSAIDYSITQSVNHNIFFKSYNSGLSSNDKLFQLSISFSELYGGIGIVGIESDNNSLSTQDLEDLVDFKLFEIDIINNTFYYYDQEELNEPISFKFTNVLEIEINSTNSFNFKQYNHDFEENITYECFSHINLPTNGTINTDKTLYLLIFFVSYSSDNLVTYHAIDSNSNVEFYNMSCADFTFREKTIYEIDYSSHLFEYTGNIIDMSVLIQENNATGLNYQQITLNGVKYYNNTNLEDIADNSTYIFEIASFGYENFQFIINITITAEFTTPITEFGLLLVPVVVISVPIFFIIFQVVYKKK